MEAYMTPERVKEKYGVGIGTVESACARGAILGAYKLDNVWYMSKGSVAAWLKRSGRDADRAV